jgi:hypothetical protein
VQKIFSSYVHSVSEISGSQAASQPEILTSLKKGNQAVEIGPLKIL